MMLSAELALEDFLRKCSDAPVRVMLERTPSPRSMVEAARYEYHTTELVLAMRVGVPTRVEAAVLAMRSDVPSWI